jgi:hypothetical protein
VAPRPSIGSSVREVTDAPAAARTGELLRLDPGLRGGLPALAVFVALVATAVENGGFFSGSWAAAAVGFLWLTAVALLLGMRVELTALEWAWIGSFAGFLVWTAFSAAWSVNPTESLLEARRALVYLAAVGAIVLLSTRRSPPYVLGAVITAAGVVITYGLARYLVAFERRPDEFQGNLLFRPLGYANAMGILAGLGIVLAVGFAVGRRAKVSGRSRRPRSRRSLPQSGSPPAVRAPSRSPSVSGRCCCSTATGCSWWAP